MNLLHDHHIHTIYSGHSDAAMTVDSVIRQAASVGLRRIVVLEHVPPVTGSPMVESGQISARQLREPIRLIENEVHSTGGESSVRVLVGAEIDADPNCRDGRLLLQDLSGIDVTLASTHYLPENAEPWYKVQGVLAEGRLKVFLDEWTEWTVRVAANPAVDILAHPGVEMACIGAIASFEGEVLERFERVLRACAQHKTAIELNETVLRKIGPRPAKSYENVFALARDLGVKISLGSDAHHPQAIGQYSFVRGIVERLGLTHENFLHPVSRR